jgi:hypothetical protein
LFEKDAQRIRCIDIVINHKNFSPRHARLSCIDGELLSYRVAGQG